MYKARVVKKRNRNKVLEKDINSEINKLIKILIKKIY